MWPQFKPSKSMPVSRMECQMEWLSIGDETVASFRPVRRAWPCCGSVIDLSEGAAPPCVLPDMGLRG